MGENDNYTKDMIKDVVKNDKDYEHVVIIGGGDLIIAANLLEKYPNVKKVTVCEIDNQVVEVTKRFFQFAQNIDNHIAAGKLEIIIQGGAQYMAKLLKEDQKAGTIGAVIIDCTDFALDESSIAAELFTPSFYKQIHELLGQGAGFSQQITKMAYKDAFDERVSQSGFGKCNIVMS